MKQDTHPTLHQATVKCTGCGNEFQTLSVLEEITVSICSNCHPFFTGAKRLVDTEGRIKKFERRYQQAEAKQQRHKEQRQKQRQRKQNQQSAKEADT